jgi:hypothetical protein
MRNVCCEGCVSVFNVTDKCLTRWDVYEWVIWGKFEPCESRGCVVLVPVTVLPDAPGYWNCRSAVPNFVEIRSLVAEVKYKKGLREKWTSRQASLRNYSSIMRLFNAFCVNKAK